MYYELMEEKRKFKVPLNGIKQTTAPADFIWVKSIPGIDPSSVKIVATGSLIQITYLLSFSAPMKAILGKPAARGLSGLLEEPNVYSRMTVDYSLGDPEMYDFSKAQAHVENGVFALWVPAKPPVEPKSLTFNIPVNPL